MLGDGHTWTLDAARQSAGLSHPDLWVRYIGIGGTATPDELAAFVEGNQPTSRLQHDIAAQAINDRLIELGRPPTAPYLSQTS